MRWLRNLFGPSDFVPSYGQEADATAALDWAQTEDTLVSAARAAIGKFAARHANETFHRFGLDCTAETAEVLLCLDTRAGGDDPGASTLWGFGDWTHQGFNVPSSDWRKAWGRVEQDIGNAVNSAINQRRFDALEAIKSGFMDMTCRALRRLQHADEFALLRKSEGFAVLSCEHDESHEDAFARLDRFPVSGNAG